MLACDEVAELKRPVLAGTLLVANPSASVYLICVKLQAHQVPNTEEVPQHALGRPHFEG